MPDPIDLARRVLPALLLGMLPACQVAVTLPRFDELNRSLGIQALVVDESFSLYSPYRLERTAAFAAAIREELPAVARVMGTSLTEPVIFCLVVMPASEREIEMGPEKATLAGWANGSRVVTVYLDPDASADRRRGPIETTKRLVIRHELAHSCLHQIAGQVEQWLNEGVAEEVEAMRWSGGVLRPSRITPLLRELRLGLTPSQRPISRILAWRRGTDPDVWSRRLARALIRFLWERSGEAHFSDAVRAIAARSDQEILALEGYWQEWIGGEGAISSHWVDRRADPAASGAIAARAITGVGTPAPASRPRDATGGATGCSTPGVVSNGVARPSLSQPTRSHPLRPPGFGAAAACSTGSARAGSS